MKTRIVFVRAVPRQGHKMFCRGGHRWPEAGRLVVVTEELLSVLKAERMLAVDLEPMLDGEQQPEAGVLEYLDNRFDDRAWNASAAARAQNEQLRAEKAALEALAENEVLKKQVEEMRARVASLEAPAREKAKKA